MNSNFSLKRLWLYANADIVSKRLLFMWFSVGIFILSMVIHYFKYLTTTNFTAYDGTVIAIDFTSTYISLWFVLFGIISYTISTSFKGFYDKRYASANIMLPVSCVEKFTYIAVLNMLIIPLVSICLAWLVSQGWAWYFNISNQFIALEVFEGSLYKAFIILFMPVSIFFLGAIFFRRRQYIFTILSVAAMMTIMIIMEKYIKINFDVIENWWVLLLLEISLVGVAFMLFCKLQITK